MLLNHIGLVSSSEEQSDRFFTKALGLTKVRTGTLSAELARRLFDLDEDFTLLHYGDGELQFEVFVPLHGDLAPHVMSHVCLEVTDRSTFLERCRALGVAIVEAPKGDSLVVFVKDFDGNLFEIKEKR